MTKVLVVGSRAESLNKAKARGPLLEALVARGIEVHAAAPTLTGNEMTRDWLREVQIECHDISLSRSSFNPFGDLITLAALYRTMRRIRPEIYIGYNIKPVIWGILAARLAGVPQRVALITGLGYAFADRARGRQALIRWIVSLLYRAALRRSTLIIFQNHDDPNDLMRANVIGCHARIKIVNGSGVDTVAYPIVSMPGGPLRFLLIARLLGAKGVREYAAAATELHRLHPYLEFHLVGGLDPNPDGIRESEVLNWSARGDIIWHGILGDIRSVISSTHVFVLPSYYREGTPRSILEAMSMGRPVITTDSPGCRETVEEGVNGFLVPPRDAKALARAMERFVSDPSLAQSMGASARRIAEDRYDVRKVNAEMLSAIGISPHMEI